MKVLLTGRGTSGSWQIRGLQLAAAMGAKAVPEAVEMESFDVVVLVKRPTAGIAERARRAGVPLIWDVVDSWPQPDGNTWDEIRCRQWLRDRVMEIRPAGIVAATRRMAEDCAAFGVPVLWLPHHAWQSQRRNPIRPEIQVVGYQGGPMYLGSWVRVLQRACAAHGWRFEPQAQQLADVDVVVALREAAGYAPRHWKSNVKLANAQGTGTPFIGSPEAGYIETASGAEFWADSEADIRAALGAMAARDVRLALSRHLLAAAPHIDDMAAKYLKWLRQFA